jgi:hypothetical protein
MTHAISDEYAAAWIETRGQVQTNVGGVGRSRPQVRITAVDPAVPEALCEFYGVGKLDTFTPRTAPDLTNLAIKCATYKRSNDGRKSCLLEPPITRKPRRYQVYEGLASDLSATHIPLMCRRLYGEVCT